MAKPMADRAQELRRRMRDDDWWYTPRVLIGTWIFSIAFFAIFSFVLFRNGGEVVRDALVVPTLFLGINWWRAKHRRPRRAVVPEDWYPDPSGKHEQRYWDGKHWTEKVLDGTEHSLDW
jgi:hypothetical protein